MATHGSSRLRKAAKGLSLQDVVGCSLVHSRSWQWTRAFHEHGGGSLVDSITICMDSHDDIVVIHLIHGVYLKHMVSCQLNLAAGATEVHQSHVQAFRSTPSQWDLQSVCVDLV